MPGKLRSWLKHLKTMRNASRMGVFFPSAKSPQPAPGGSVDPPASGWNRLVEEVSWFRITEHHLHLETFPRHLNILHLTDLHLREESDWLDLLIDQLRGLEPDLTLITGDLVTRGWTKEAAVKLLKALPKSTLGTYAIMGNWEYWSGASPQTWGPFLKEYGIQLLRETWIDFGSWCLAGTDDHLAGNSEPEKWLNALSEKPTIVMTHSPALFPRLVYPHVGLVLAGHTHGGQVRIPKWGAIWVPRGTGPYVSGWFKEQNTHLFVSRGLGWSVAPLRFKAPPELAWISINPPKVSKDDCS